ncbi:MAG TPA: type II toxin-antitoxin system VapC family toxin [Microvirga sp.]|jgi:ribonuclease VapC|nr:type II toxin-antitoxin system VapC family toxin [Microvirga sp.]
MVVDTSVLVAIFREEPEAAIFVDRIDAAAEARLSLVSFLETFSVLCSRRVGGTRSQVERLVRDLGLALRPVDEAQHRHAVDALLRFGKGRHPASLNIGDCFSYALACALDAPLLFKGDDFARTDIVPAWRP